MCQERGAAAIITSVLYRLPYEYMCELIFELRYHRFSLNLGQQWVLLNVGVLVVQLVGKIWRTASHAIFDRQYAISNRNLFFVFSRRIGFDNTPFSLLDCAVIQNDDTRCRL